MSTTGNMRDGKGVAGGPSCSLGQAGRGTWSLGEEEKPELALAAPGETLGPWGSFLSRGLARVVLDCKGPT